VQALLAAPALGPKLLFLSGGSALRPLSRQLKRFTHNSIHLITPFDSGGSSAEIRRAFAMLSVGDLRNRLVALANENSEANRDLYRLFCHRLPIDRSSAELADELARLVKGEHALVSPLPVAIRRVVCDTLQFLSKALPPGFELAGANVGNLLLTGAYLSHHRDLEPALLIFGLMLGAFGVVEPTAQVDAQLAVRLVDGSCVVGQHRITGKEVPPIAAPISEVFLTSRLDSERPIGVPASPKALALLAEADLICYPYGSFYSSVVANLLPQGIGRAIAAVRCPKVYLPNWGADPEQIGMSLSGSVERLLAAVRADAPEARQRDIVQRVIIDTHNLEYSLDLDVANVQALGVEVIDVPFAERVADENQFETLAKLLISLS
jgi:CofD-related protein of GAK system